jgi:hypothetical protein
MALAFAARGLRWRSDFRNGYFGSSGHAAIGATPQFRDCGTYLVFFGLERSYCEFDRVLIHATSGEDFGFWARHLAVSSEISNPELPG